MCPKCSSSRYRVDDLLPNLSLRQAIEHFLVSQMVATKSENALRRYVPDGESGIQVKDVTCAVTVVQREPEMPHSPSATGKGSNQVMEKPCYDSLANEKSLSRTMQQIDGGRGRYANHRNFPNVPDDLQGCLGERKCLNLLLSHVRDEGGNMNFLPAGRVKKDRNCYLCGSPDHLIRECVFASYPNPMLQTGNLIPMGGFSAYRSPFWTNNTYSTPRLFATSTPRPYANMYGNAPFNASMIPQTPMVPPYMQSMHAGMPLPGGQHFQAEPNFKEHCPKNDREATGKFHKEREPCKSCSDDSFAPKMHRKHLHDEKRTEKSRRYSSASRDKVVKKNNFPNSGNCFLRVVNYASLAQDSQPQLKKNEEENIAPKILELRKWKTYLNNLENTLLTQEDLDD